MLDAAVVAGDAYRLRAEGEFGAGATVRPCEEMRGRNRHDPRHDPVHQFDDVHLLALAARDRGKLEADKAGADHDDRSGGRLGDRAARGSRRSYAGSTRRPARCRAVAAPGCGRRWRARGGRSRCARRSRAAAAGAVRSISTARRALQIIDAMIAVERLRPHRQQIEPDFAVEVVLRQRRALIGQRRFVADQRCPAVEAVLAQRCRQLKPRMAGADNDDRVGHRADVGRGSPPALALLHRGGGG